MTGSPAQQPSARLAELIAALSLATGLGMGQPMELPLRAAKIAVDIGRGLGLERAELSDVYYLALVVHIGCTSDSFEFARYAGGDDIALRQHSIDWPASEPATVLGDVVRHLGTGKQPLERAGLVGGMLLHGRERARQIAVAHCEAGSRLAERLGLSAGIRAGLAHEQERWDGKGLPDGLAGDSLSIAKRVVAVAHGAVSTAHAGGSVVGMLRARRGHAYDPGVVDAFLDLGGLDALDPAADAWTAGLAAEPQPFLTIDSPGLDRVALACADFADLKSPHFLAHSTGVAGLAAAAAEAAGLSGAEAVDVRRAGLLHDLGRAGVPNGVWDKTGRLDTNDLERVRLHAYYTERVLARSRPLAPLALIAGCHHENLDGSGYHRGVGAAQLSRPARLLRVADCFDAMTSARPYRPPLGADECVLQLKMEVEAGRLDAAAVAAVLEASGAGPVRLRPPRPAGLSDREIDVLRLLVVGMSNAEMAARLHLSAKTVGHHVQHIYDKVGVTSRAAAALFAMEAGLV